MSSSSGAAAARPRRDPSVVSVALLLGLALLGAGGPSACRLEPLRTVDLLAVADAGTDEADPIDKPPPRCNQELDGTGAAAPATGDDAGATAIVCDDFEPPVAMACGSGAHDQGECPSAVGVGSSCSRTCGPARMGTENCECMAASSCSQSSQANCLRCSPCSFDPAKSYSCYALPQPTPSCPRNGGVIQSGYPCPFAACQPCATNYLDSSGAMKEGYCVCDHPSCKWSCATREDWPKPCLTNR